MDAEREHLLNRLHHLLNLADAESGYPGERKVAWERAVSLAYKLEVTEEEFDRLPPLSGEIRDDLRNALRRHWSRRGPAPPPPPPPPKRDPPPRAAARPPGSGPSTRQPRVSQPTVRDRSFAGVGVIVASAFLLGLVVSVLTRVGSEEAATGGSYLPPATPATVTHASGLPAAEQQTTATSAAPPSGATPTPVVPRAGFGDGVWLVGKDIQPGTYRTAGAVPAPYCSWERLSAPGASSPVASDTVFSGYATVTIAASDGAFESNGCGEWQRLS